MNNIGILFNRKIFEWLPIVSSMVSSSMLSLITKQKSTAANIVASTVFGYLIYEKIKHWHISKNLSHLVKLQNELHILIKQCLKILRRTQIKNMLITELHEKQE